MLSSGCKLLLLPTIKEYSAEPQGVTSVSKDLPQTLEKTKKDWEWKAFFLTEAQGYI